MDQSTRDPWGHERISFPFSSMNHSDRNRKGFRWVTEDVIRNGTIQGNLAFVSLDHGRSHVRTERRRSFDACFYDLSKLPRSPSVRGLHSIDTFAAFHPNGTHGFRGEDGEVERRSIASYRTLSPARNSSRHAILPCWKRESIVRRSFVMPPLQSLSRLVRWFFPLLSWLFRGSSFCLFDVNAGSNRQLPHFDRKEWEIFLAYARPRGPLMSLAW